MRLLVFSLCLASMAASAASLSLEGNTDSLEIVLSGTGSVDYQISWTDVTASAISTPGTNNGNITSGTTTVVSAPAASHWKHIRGIRLFNAGAAETITVQVDRSAANLVAYKASVGTGETIVMTEDGYWSIQNQNGTPRGSVDVPGFSGRSLHFSKVASAVDTIGYHYAYGKDNGFPGAYTLQSPGLNGYTTDCSIASQTTDPNGAVQMGAWVLNDPATGGWYLTRWGLSGAVVGSYELIDVVWYNTGINVTTITTQAITTPTLPARDINGAASGEGYGIALLSTGANTNAGAIANTTLTYVNSGGTGSRTAKLSAAVGFQAPATPVVGTWIPFTLAAGDTGIQSVSEITLGTSYGAGSLSLVIYRPISQIGQPVANNFTGGSSLFSSNPGIRIWNNSCLWLTFFGAPATTAPSVYGGFIELMER